jgi:hypothetical protein
MKKFIGIIIVIVILGAGYVAFFKNKSTSQSSTATPGTEVVKGESEASPAPKADAKLLERLRNVSVTASEDGGSVTLSGGEAQFAIEGSKKGSVSLGSVAAEATTGSRKDIISYITVNPGNGQYLVLFEDKGTTLSQKSLVFLGSNVTVNSIVTASLGKGGPDYVISVKGLEKGFETTFIYTVVGGQIDVAKALKL